MKDKPTKPKPTSKAKPKTTAKAGTTKPDKTPGGGGVKRQGISSADMDLTSAKKTAMPASKANRYRPQLGGNPIEGWQAREALAKLYGRYCEAGANPERHAEASCLADDLVHHAETTLLTLVDMARRGNLKALRWLAFRSDLESYRPLRFHSSIKAHITEGRANAADLWDKVKAEAGQIRTKESRSKMRGWQKNLLNQAFQWREFLKSMPRDFRSQRWLDFQRVHSPTCAASKEDGLPFPESFVADHQDDTSLATAFVDEVLIPIMQTIHRHDSAQWKSIAESQERANKLEPAWTRYRKEALRWLCPKLANQSRGNKARIDSD
jgi:hypothetical protein